MTKWRNIRHPVNHFRQQRLLHWTLFVITRSQWDVNDRSQVYSPLFYWLPGIVIYTATRRQNNDEVQVQYIWDWRLMYIKPTVERSVGRRGWQTYITIKAKVTYASFLTIHTISYEWHSLYHRREDLIGNKSVTIYRITLKLNDWWHAHRQGQSIANF